MDLALATVVDMENPIVGDLRLRGGQLELVDGVDAIAQHLRVRLLWVRGEWFRDIRTGVPYFEAILRKGSTRRAEAALRSTIVQTPGVRSLDFFRLAVDHRTRQATLSFDVSVDTGARLTFRDFLLGVS